MSRHHMPPADTRPGKEALGDEPPGNDSRNDVPFEPVAHRARWSAAVALMGMLGACSAPRDVPPSVESPAAVAPAAPETAPWTPTPSSAPTTPQPEGPSGGTSAPAGDCDTRKATVDAALKEAGRCNGDADCTTLMPSCPFGCGVAIHRSTDVARIEAEIAAYKRDCNECVYRCRPIERAPTCRAGSCSLE